MWDYIKTAFSIVRNSITPTNNSQGNNMTNIGNYIIVAMGVFICMLCITIYTNRTQIKELQGQVNSGQVALEYQNAMIEANRTKNEKLNQELKDYVAKVKQDFANIKAPDLNHKEPQNQCETFIYDLAEAYQK